MMRRKGLKEINPDEIEVRLKRFLGLTPRHYVPVVWAALAAGLVFFLLVLPGLRKNGTWFTVYSDPPDASVYANSLRLGPAGEAVFVPRGPQTITVERPGFEKAMVERDVKGRVFASRLLPRRDVIEVGLSPLRNEGIWRAAAASFAGWTATGPERGRYALPATLTAAARDAVAAGKVEVGAEAYLRAFLPMARDSRHAADVLRGAWILAMPDAAPGPASLAAVIDELAGVFGDAVMARGVSVLFETDLEGFDKFAGVPAVSTVSLRQSEEAYAQARAARGYSLEFVGEIPFVRIPGLTLPIGDIEIADRGDYNPRFGALPVPARVAGYRIARSEVTNDEYERFIRDNPRWAGSRRDNLVESGLADGGYLASWNGDVPAEGTGSLPVTEISWQAASAYARWFTEANLPEGETARLPREDEWEIAARLNASPADTSNLPTGIRSASGADQGEIGLLGMAGNVREWCYNPFRYSENLFRPGDGNPAYQDPESLLASPQRPVRGGAFIDDALVYPAAARGFLDDRQTSPVVGFRLVVVPR